MVPYLVECGYFTEVEFVFLVVGHTKNACDRIFNNLKGGYRLRNVWTFTQLLDVLDESYKVTIHATTHEEFFDWNTHLLKWYSKMASKILPNHIFHVHESQIANNGPGGKKKIVINIKEADIADSSITTHQVRKKTAPADLPNTFYPDMLPCEKVNPYKVVEFFDKWKKHVPEEYKEELCPEPTPEERAQVKKEKGARGEIKKFKKEQKKEALKKMEKEAFGLPATKESSLCPPVAQKSPSRQGRSGNYVDENPAVAERAVTEENE